MADKEDREKIDPTKSYPVTVDGKEVWITGKDLIANSSVNLKRDKLLEEANTEKDRIVAEATAERQKILAEGQSMADQMMLRANVPVPKTEDKEVDEITALRQLTGVDTLPQVRDPATGQMRAATMVEAFQYALDRKVSEAAGVEAINREAAFLQQKYPDISQEMVDLAIARQYREREQRKEISLEEAFIGLRESFAALSTDKKEEEIPPEKLPPHAPEGPAPSDDKKKPKTTADMAKVLGEKFEEDKGGLDVTF